MLEAYIFAARQHHRDVEVFVIGDLATPPEAGRLCAELGAHFFDVTEQERYLARWPELARFLPWGSVQRRNVGLLLAWESEAEIVVTVDDDCIPLEPDYFGRHAHLGDEPIPFETVATASGWWNVCTLLQEEEGNRFYPRGFPLSQRRRARDHAPIFTTRPGRAVVNAGLWLGDPDVDAATRLSLPVHVTSTSESYRARVALAPGTWAPFNSQNTALLRELIPAYFLFPHVGRYDDVWASYIVRRIADDLGDLVTYGAPLVYQRRNEHNLYEDFNAEKFGSYTTDTFVAALRACTVTARDYAGAYAEIAEQLLQHWPPGRLRRVAEGARLWTSVFA